MRYRAFDWNFWVLPSVLHLQFASPMACSFEAFQDPARDIQKRYQYFHVTVKLSIILFSILLEVEFCGWILMDSSSQHHSHVQCRMCIDMYCNGLHDCSRLWLDTCCTLVYSNYVPVVWSEGSPHECLMVYILMHVHHEKVGQANVHFL